MSRSASRASGLLPIDRLFLAYIGATGLLLLLAGGAAAWALAALHAGGAAAAVVWSRAPLPVGRAARFLRLAYPVALTPLLYAELAVLNQLFGTGYLDATVQAWEAALFGVQASVEWSRAWPGFWWSELLHLGYVSYYALVPVALLGVWATRGDDALHRATVATALAFFASYAVFIVFPVAGPRYLFPKIEGPPAEGALFGLVHAILEGASSKGTAFPSSHVAAAGAAVWTAGLEDRRWGWLLALPWLALTAGTVYGRFHYAVDALAGVVMALAAVAVARLAGSVQEAEVARASSSSPGSASRSGASADAPASSAADSSGSGNSSARMEEGSTGSPPT